MNDLIWIGNTLYPRWIVIAAMAMTFIVPLAIAGLVRIALKLHRRA